MVFTHINVPRATNLLFTDRFISDGIYSSIINHVSFLFSATVPNSTCLSSSLINPSSCSQTIPTGDLQFLFTPCTVGTVNTMTPTSGTQGTSITITGTGFSTTQCENKVLIGSYECPIQSVTSTQIVCVIGSNSMLSAATIHEVHIQRDRQGMLSRNGLIQFQFQAKITSISPTTGTKRHGRFFQTNITYYIF